jgi:hypothetical protein
MDLFVQGLLTARSHVLGAERVKREGVVCSLLDKHQQGQGLQRVVVYASEKAHRCVDQVGT